MMMGETALAAAMKQAGVDTDAALLRAIAEEQLRKFGIDSGVALSRFTDEVRDTGGIWTKLIPYSVTRDHARIYLEQVAADMRGDGLVPAKAGDGADDESRLQAGPVEIREDGGSGTTVGSLRRGGPSSSPTDRNDAVRVVVDDREEHGRVVPIPKPARGLDALQLHAKVNSVFDSYLTRQGPIGDLVWSALPRLSSENAREAALLKLIYEHTTPGDPNARVRDVIKIDDLQRMIQKAAEIANG